MIGCGCENQEGENGGKKVAESRVTRCDEQHSTSALISIIKQLEERIQEKEKATENLTQEFFECSRKIESSPNKKILMDLSMATQKLEGKLREKENTIEKLKQDQIHHSTQCDHLSEKDNRIEELEEALRESVRITADREIALDAEIREKKMVDEKICRLEQRLQSLQNAQSLKCRQCRPNRQRLQDLESRLSKLLAERRAHLHELFDMKQEALEAAISERDAQLALLEVSGIRTARAAERADDLKADRKRLMELMKIQNEKRVKLLLEYEEKLPDTETYYDLGMLNDTEDVSVCKSCEQ